jgi:hypothetical protein
MMNRLLAHAALLGALTAFPRLAHSQGQVVYVPPKPAVVHTTNSVTVPATFTVIPGSVTQNSQQANPCNPGACYDATTTVKANQKWQLQVTLNQTPQFFYVNWIQAPQNVQVRLAAGTYVTIATGSGSTPSLDISNEYNANKTSGPGGFVPTAAQLAAVLSYRVIPAP